MTAWEIYWLLKLDDIHHAAVGILFFGLVALVPLGVYMSCSASEKTEVPLALRNAFVVGLVFWLLLLPVKIFLPTTAQMAAIMVVPPIVSNERVQQIPEKVLELVEKKLDELKGAAKQ